MVLHMCFAGADLAILTFSNALLQNAHTNKLMEKHVYCHIHRP